MSGISALVYVALLAAFVAGLLVGLPIGRWRGRKHAAALPGLTKKQWRDMRRTEQPNWKVTP